MKLVSNRMRCFLIQASASKVAKPALLIILLNTLALLRIRMSFDRMAPDPGFWFLQQVYEENFLHVFSNQDGFLHIAPRLCYEVVSLFPIEKQAVAGSVGMQLIFGSVATLVFFVLRIETRSFLLSLLGSLIVVTVPAAGESTVGNLGSVKWPLTILLVFVLSSQTTMRRFQKLSIACALLVGLSQPYSVLFILPSIFKRFVARNALSFAKAEWCILLTTVVQLATWITSGVALQKYGEPTYFAWTGMGIFWYSVWLVPTLTGLFVLLLSYLNKRLPGSFFRFEVRLASSAVLLAVASYVQLGIKDSSAVAPQAVSLVALFLTVQGIGDWVGSNARRLLTAFFLVLVMIASLKWFNASWYLTSGPTWSSEIERTRSMCLQDGVDVVTIKQFMGDTTLDCAQVLNGR
jgi:hypothetical protein